MSQSAQSVYAAIRSNPKFAELVGRRSRFAWTLSIVVLVLYYGLMMVVAFKPALLHIPLGPDTVVTYGIPIGVGMLILFWLMTGLYIRRANDDFDVINRQLIAEAQR